MKNSIHLLTKRIQKVLQLQDLIHAIISKFIGNIPLNLHVCKLGLGFLGTTSEGGPAKKCRQKMHPDDTRPKM